VVEGGLGVKAGGIAVDGRPTEGVQAARGVAVCQRVRGVVNAQRCVWRPSQAGSIMAAPASMQMEAPYVSDPTMLRLLCAWQA